MDNARQFEYNKCTAAREVTKLDKEKIGRRLRELRGSRDAQEVANTLGISTSALFMYERGERIPRDQIKVKIAQYYGLPVQEIFFDD